MTLLPDPTRMLADRFGDRTAIVDDATGETITYADLDDRAARAGGFLSDRGVEAGDRVATLSTNRVELIDLLLGAAKLGACLAPLNVRLAGEEVRRMLEDLEPAAVLADADLADLPGEDRPVVDLDATDPAGPPIEDAPGVEAGDAGLILHTGGTTGFPKGAVLPWRAVVANADNTVEGWGLTGDDATPLLFPMFHTGGWNVTTIPLMTVGGTTVLMDGFDPGRVIEVVEDQGLTLVVGVPTMFHAIQDHPRFGEADLSSVRMWISGGAPCPVPLMETYRKHGYGLKMGYGLTEAGPNNFHIPADRAGNKPRSVGRPLPGVETRVVDPETGEPVAQGERGELWIAGDHVMDRYWRRPEATDEVLVDGWLRTGDVARVDEDGDHYIVDRIKEMFISGGENVYPVEVEQVLSDHPDVDLVAVFGVPDDRWGEVGKAVIEPVEGATVDADDLRAFAADRLARYKVPEHVEVVDGMPLTPAGKIDKQALQEEAG